MSVVGFDIGNRNCTIAVAQRGGIDVIANEVSNRQTPTMVTLGEKERYIGEASLTQWLRYIKATVTDVKRVIGRTITEEDTQIETKRVAYAIKDAGNGKIGVQVQYQNNPTTFSTEAVAGMVLGKLKRTTGEAIGSHTKVNDVVISVPTYWTDAQRRALLDASKIAGLNSLRLFNETAAAALGYGIYKTDLPEKDKDPVRVLFVDVGESSTNVSAVAFHKGQLKMLATAHDPHLGGRDFDEALVKHFAKEFQTKYKLDVYSNAKALIRLRIQCEKVKKILSANPEAPLNIDNLMNDTDVRAMIDRKRFEELSGDLLDRICVPVQKVLEETGIPVDQFSSIELIGGGSRQFSVQKRLGEFLKRETSRTLNSEEAVSRGCALQCAMLSPVFKVREFTVNDITKFPIRLSWKSTVDGVATEGSDVVFKANHPIPSPKMITFPRADSIELSADYEPHPEFPKGHPTRIGTYTISNISKPTSSEPSNIKVKVKLDLNGIFSIESAQLIEVLPEQDGTGSPAPSSPAPAAPMETEKPAEANKGENAEQTENKEEKKEEKKRKTKRTDLTVVSHTLGLSPKELQAAIDLEQRMVTADLLAIETQEVKNALESYVYDTRSRLNGDLAEFSDPKERSTLLQLLDSAENWLYGDGEDVSKGEYQQKLDELKKLGDPIVLRHREHELRPESTNALVDAIALWQGEASSTHEKYDHIEQAEKDKILTEVENARKWLLDVRARQDALPKTANPVFSASDALARKNNLEKFAKQILNKPKPKPKPAEPAPKPAETKPADTPNPPPTEQTQDQQQQPPQQEQQQEQQPKSESSMDVD